MGQELRPNIPSLRGKSGWGRVETMSHVIKDEDPAPRVSDRSTFQRNWMHCAFERKLT